MDTHSKDDDSRARLQAMQASLSMVEFSPSGEILEANERFLRTFGYEFHEIRGRHHAIFVTDEELCAEAYNAFWADLAEGIAKDGQFIRVAKDRTELWAIEHYAPVIDESGNVGRVIQVTADITPIKQKHIQGERHSKAIKRAQGIIQFDLNGFILEVNDIFCDMVGYSKEELLGGHHSLLAEPEYKKSVDYVRFWSELRRGIPQSNEFRRLTRSGEHIWIHGTYSPIMDSSGTVQKVVKFASNISERKSLEHQLQVALKAREDFIGNISHEIRTPLNGVLGLSSALEKTPLQDEQRKLTRVIKRSAEHLNSLVSDMLDIASIQSGNFKLNPKRCEINAVISDAIEVMRARADDKGLALTFRSDVPDGTNVSCDQVRLSQIVSNLISNAVKFTHEGGVDVEVTGDRRDRHLLVRIDVRDTGIGFDDEQREKIFGRYCQGATDTNQKYGGTGLGLAISRSLAEAMGGNITAASEPDKGSVFSVSLVLDISSQTVAANDSPPRADERCTLSDFAQTLSARVLLAEDLDVNRMVVKAILGHTDTTLVCVENGQRAVDIVRQEEFDVILMDMEMPELDGAEATKAIIENCRSEGRTPPPIIMLTANATGDHRDVAIQAGCDKFLPKPVTSESLIGAIRDVVGDAPEPGGPMERHAKHLALTG